MNSRLAAGLSTRSAVLDGAVVVVGRKPDFEALRRNLDIRGNCSTTLRLRDYVAALAIAGSNIPVRKYTSIKPLPFTSISLAVENAKLLLRASCTSCVT